MSTRASLFYLPDEKIHVYREAFEEENKIYIELKAIEFSADSAGNLTFALTQDIFDKFVEECRLARINEIAKLSEETEKQRLREYKCIEEYGEHHFRNQGWGGISCTRCYKRQE